MHALNSKAKNVPEKVCNDFQWIIKGLGDKNLERFGKERMLSSEIDCPFLADDYAICLRKLTRLSRCHLPGLLGDEPLAPQAFEFS